MDFHTNFAQIGHENFQCEILLGGILFISMVCANLISFWKILHWNCIEFCVDFWNSGAILMNTVVNDDFLVSSWIFQRFWTSLDFFWLKFSVCQALIVMDVQFSWLNAFVFDFFVIFCQWNSVLILINTVSASKIATSLSQLEFVYLASIFLHDQVIGFNSVLGCIFFVSHAFFCKNLYFFEFWTCHLLLIRYVTITRFRAF